MEEEELENESLFTDPQDYLAFSSVLLLIAHNACNSRNHSLVSHFWISLYLWLVYICWFSSSHFCTNDCVKY